MSVYLDYNATAKVRPEAVEAMAAALEAGGNPSSVHAFGRAAAAVLEAARADVAALAGASASAVTFVSGGTEANALALESAARSGAERIIVSATEHDAVLQSALGLGIAAEIWPVDGRGVADLDWLADQLARGPRALVCLMLANNETGVIQPVAEAAAMVRVAGGRLHVDAVQAAGKIAIDLEALGADTLAFSAHKIGGPQGAGALLTRAGVTIVPSLRGGGQERGLRAGTPNTPGAAGFGAAARAALADLDRVAQQATWRDGLSRRVAEAGAIVLGADAPRLPQTLAFASPGFGSDLQVMGLDLEGVMVSAGAACSSGKVKPSRVVAAMGREDLADCAIRVSGGWASTEDDWRRGGDVWIALRARRAARQAAAA